MISRRTLLKGVLALGATGMTFGGYALAEPFRLKVTRYALTPPRWTSGLKLRLAVVADLHANDPWMDLDRIAGIVTRTNALGADAILLLGDYVASNRIGKFSRHIASPLWAAELAKLKAPLGVHAVMGNHDWWDDLAVQRRRAGKPEAQRALEAAGIPTYENRAVRLAKDGKPFWLAGLGDQWAYWPRRENYEAFRRGGKKAYDGVHDVRATLAAITDDAPVVLMAHEPDIFAELPDRFSLTISGHTHGGQVNMFGWTPIVPSKYGTRYVYGHIVENNRNLVVSGGLGCSGLPIRFGSPPELVVVDLG
ncbi:MAG TPA: metallophosphoesterase [Hyphomicrobiaceae bacterium]|nr:metallophosphoesterase [Hyphomicrobiaceae bacterium]